MTETPPTLYCYNHPSVETSLRCNNCDRPICAKCAVLTPTGYRCKECIRSQQKIFNTAIWFDYPLAFIIGAILSYIGGIAVSFVSFFVFFVAPVVGIVIAEAVRFVTRRRRSKLLFMTATAGTLIGSLVQMLPIILSFLLGGRIPVLSLVWYAVYAFMVTSAVYYRLQGINIR
jgi:hypothetical protein